MQIDHIRRKIHSALRYMNARSTLNKTSDLQQLVSNVDPNIVCICVTWLDNTISNSSILLLNYQLFRVDRTHGTDRQGPVLVAVKPHLNPRLVSHTTDNELLYVDICSSGSTLRLCVAYWSPSMSYSEKTEFIQFLSSSLAG